MIGKINRTIIVFMLLLSTFFVLSSEVESGYNLEFGERTLREKDEGGDVAILQQRLKDLSYYKGKIDGIYGSKTKIAVKKFQKEHGLKADGIVGPETFDKIPSESLLSRKEVSREDITQLARVIHGEARGEVSKGKIGVGAVIINRVESDEFPDTIKEVLLQPGQFSCMLDGQANFYPDDSSIQAARAALLGYDPTYDSLYFYNPRIASNVHWIEQRPIVTRIGSHIFAR